MQSLNPSRRECLRMAAIGAASLAAPALAAPAWDAIVSKSGRSGSVSTIAAALDLARAAGRLSAPPFRILIEPGRYDEKLHIATPAVTLAAAGPGVILTHGASAGQTGPDGKPWGTGGSATLTIEARAVSLIGLTIANDFDFLHARSSGPYGGRQAVALSLAGGADRTIVRNCRITGYQDTFYLRDGRALIDDCLISGGTDFIFGGAAALFRRCEIVSRFIPGGAIQGYVAAPSTRDDRPAGLVFDRCRLVRESGVADGSVFLGRPWRAGGDRRLTGMAAFLDCWMDRHIRPEGWTAMHWRAPDGAEGWLTPQQARLYEQGSRGPGAGQPSTIRRPLPPELAGIASPDVLFGDWRPD